jgi:hypothetical protein
MENPNLDGKIELDDLLLKAKSNTENFIKHLEGEESGERIETVDAMQNQMKADKTNTNRKKLQFIDEIKDGLGSKIKEGNGIKIKLPTFKEKFIKFLTSIYSKF